MQSSYYSRPYGPTGDLPSNNQGYGSANLRAGGLRSRHRDGINAVFSDGSAAWVPKTQFETNLNAIVEPFSSNPANNIPNYYAIWRLLDTR